MLRILIVFGTRPEAIKMAPVVIEMRRRPAIETIVCVTGQHRDMLDDALDVFAIRPDYDLNIMRQDQTLSEATISTLAGLSPLLDRLKPDRVLTQGDTTTALAASMAAFYAHIPVGHVEAGMRTRNLCSPWPEEFNRRVVDIVADLLWAPTAGAAEALKCEGIPDRNIFITGNTVIDSLLLAKEKIDNDKKLNERIWSRLPRLNPTRKLILVTGHRRENFGKGLTEMCIALKYLAERKDAEVIWPVHPNPKVLPILNDTLKSVKNVHLISPLDYLSFVALMGQAFIIITDSGGIQEEAPTLAKPVLITRDTTERPEAVSHGIAALVGASSEKIISAATRLLENRGEYASMAKACNPFGDGKAAQRIADSLLDRHET